jgi:hypothetical protein
VGIIVRGKKADGATFSERTKTEVVSAHGALFLLEEPVCAGQELTLCNIPTSDEIACPVVTVRLESRSPEAKRFNTHSANLPKPSK